MMLVVLAALLPCTFDAASLRAAPVAKESALVQGPLDSCGTVAKYDNAEPKDYADAMATKFNEKTKKREPVTFKKGDEVTYKCRPGFTVDGSKDGKTEFKSVCSDMGYFKPDGVCVKASKCGAVPAIAHATATPKEIKGAVQFACNPGYSLDGEKVVPGGMAANQVFTMKCVEFSGKYEEFKGECKAYAFVPSKESTRIYTQVFEALFVATCKGKVMKAFGKGKPPPVEEVCGKLKAGSGECGGLVSDIKADFEKKKKELEKFSEKKEWYEKDEKPGVGGDAMDFCKGLWKLVEKPNP